MSQNLNPPDVPTEKVEIETVRLATFLESFTECPRGDLMKLDVETHEPEVLEGMGAYLGRLRPTMFIEILNAEVAQRVENLVRGMDYLYFNLDDIGKPKRQDRLTKSDHFIFLLCGEAVARDLHLI